MRNLLVLLALALAATPALSMPLPCGTPLMLAAGGTRDRPECDTWTESSTYPIRVHYSYGEEELAAVTLEAADLSWQMQVEEWGWAEPGGDDGLGGSDAVDYYLADTQFGGYVSPDDWWETATQAQCAGHVVINREMDLDSIRITVPHEFNHVLQLWTDCAEDPQMLEASAVFAQDWVYPELGSAWGFAAGYQEGYYRSLDYYAYAEPPQYGSFVFLQYVAERFADGTPVSTREIWDDSLQGDFGNSNTWMAALERWLEDHWADDLAAPTGDETYTEVAWREFSEWRYFLGANWLEGYLEHGHPDSLHYGIELPVAGTASLASLEEGPVDIELPHAMGELSSAAVLIRHPEEGWIVHADLTADTDSERWALSLVSLDTSTESVIERVIGDIAAGEAHASTEVLPGVDNIVAVIAQVGDGTLDPRQDDWSGDEAQIQIWIEGYEADDDDDDVADDDDDDDDGGSSLPRVAEGDGCGACATAPRRPAGATVLLTLLAAAFFRRAR
jgi:hypothetical protein